MPTNIDEIIQQDLIDKFLLNQLNKKERLDFEDLMNSDASLKETVYLQKIIIEEIIDRERILSLISKADNKVKRTKRFNLLFRIAAVFLGLIALILWQPTKKSDASIILAFAEPYPSKIKNLNVNEQTRDIGVNLLCLNLKNEECDTILKAIQLYNSRKYREASILFSNVLKTPDKNMTVSFFMANSQLQDGQVKLAISTFLFLSKQEKFFFRDQSLFYLAMAYIMSHKNHKARKILRQIEFSDNEYSFKAGQILKQLRLF